MQQKTQPIAGILSQANDQEIEMLELEASPERMATVWVSRLTQVVGAVFLVLALFVWMARPNHYRLVLALLMVAMFCAILHTYTFEDGA